MSNRASAAEDTPASQRRVAALRTSATIRSTRHRDRGLRLARGLRQRGRVRGRAAGGARGHPSHPATAAQVEDKFRENTLGLIAAERADALVIAIRNLESHETVSAVTALLGYGPRCDAAENRARLIAAAERVSAERTTDTGLQDVARAAGVGPATLYRRFGTKDGLVQEVLAVFFGRLIELARRAYAKPAETCLDTYLDTVGWELVANRGSCTACGANSRRHRSCVSLRS